MTSNTQKPAGFKPGLVFLALFTFAMGSLGCYGWWQADMDQITRLALAFGAGATAYSAYLLKPVVNGMIDGEGFKYLRTLAWAVAGCLAWQREGLGVPAVVQDATEAYRLSNDPLREFLAECCMLGADLSVSASARAEWGGI